MQDQDLEKNAVLIVWPATTLLYSIFKCVSRRRRRHHRLFESCE
jgi:hypothetical protein